MALPLVDDPYDWSVDQVVHALCVDQSSWCLTASGPILPSADVLERALRDNAVTGLALLTYIDDITLRQDLQVHLLGHRATIKQAVEALQRRSRKFAQFSSTPSGSFNLEGYPGPRFPSFAQSQLSFLSTPASPMVGRLQDTPTPSNNALESRRASVSNSLLLNQSWPSPDEPGLAPVLSSLKRKSMDGPVATPTELSVMDSGPNEATHCPGRVQEPPSNDPDEENAVTDEDGKKRRKLAPIRMATPELSPQSEQDPFTRTASPEPAELPIRLVNAPEMDQDQVRVSVDGQGRKRLNVSFLSQLDCELPDAAAIEQAEEPETAASPAAAMLSQSLPTTLLTTSQVKGALRRQDRHKVDKAYKGYLGKHALPADKLFYGEASFGDEITYEAADGNPAKAFDSADEDNFCFSSADKISEGRRLYVHGLMRHHLIKSRPTHFVKGESSFAGLLPYPVRVARKHVPLSFTLFAKLSDGGVIATREMVARWPLFQEATGSFGPREGQIPGYGGFVIPEDDVLGQLGQNLEDEDLGYLEKYRHMNDGKIIPAAFGDSGTEGEYDSETWKEIEAERGEELEKPTGRTSRRPLTREEVQDAIDVGIADLVDKWTRNKLPMRQLKAWSVWKKSRRQKSKHEEIRQAEARIRQIDGERLPKMRKEIADETWTTSLQVRKQCKIMEQSVFDREDLRWLISTLVLRREPARPPAAAKRPKATKVPVAPVSDDDIDNDGDIDVLESEVEPFGSSADEDELDGFVVGDHVAEGVDAADADMVAADADHEDLMDMEEPEDDESSEEDIIAPSGPRSRQQNRNGDRPMPDSDPDDDTIVRDPSSRDGSPGLPEVLGARGRDGTPAGTQRPRSVIDLTFTSEASAHSPPSDDSSVIIDVDANPFRASKKSRSHLASTRNTRARARKSEVIVLGDPSSDAVHARAPASRHSIDGEDYSDVAAINAKQYHRYEEARDRKRLLIKILHNMNPSNRDSVIARVSAVRMENVRSETWGALQAIRDDRDCIPGMDETTFQDVSRFARLYLMWWECKKSEWKEGWPRDVVSNCLKDSDEFVRFHDFLRQALLRYDESINDSVINDSPRASRLRRLRAAKSSKPGSLPSQTRKRPIYENVQARTRREDDRKRVANQYRRRKELEKREEKMGISSTGDPSHIIINTSRYAHQDKVYVDPHIGAKIKPHQIEGVQFLWREIVTDDKNLQGCLLAHTMGLGKTMQIITLLVAIAESARSPNSRVSSQIPESLRESRTLILCPPTLIDNWEDEFLRWAPHPIQDNLGHLRKANSSNQNERRNEITSWYDDGGVLLIGYETFRNLVLRHDEEIRLVLLEGPNIIIADEAHKMKNASSMISSAASQFRSRSRVALTGSPVANNLEEYHSMINWVAPGYLGPQVEFRAKYVEPIQEGLYQDSTTPERRTSSIMLSVLKKDLDPKVHRADISVIKDSLPPKTEFVIKVPLTKIQEEAYILYVGSMASATRQNGTAKILDVLAVLSLLCNHPVCFRNKLIAREEVAQQMMGSQVDEDVVEAVTGLGDEPVAKLGITSGLIQQQLELFENYGESLEAMVHSHRATIFDQILDAAIEAGDKTLVFSHSLPTLDYLERLLKTAKRRYLRLTGETKMTDRQRDTKLFNSGRYDVYLVSTRAGGLGLNLQAANRVIIFDFGFNPTWEAQAIGRAYRILQVKPVFVYRFTAGGTFEDVVHNKAIFKLQLASRVVDKKNPMRYAQKKFRDLLFEPKPVEQRDLAEFRGKDPLVLDRILDKQAESPIIRSIELEETFQKDDDDVLTAADKAEAKQLLEDSQLKRSDPEAYERLMERRRQDDYAKATAAAQARVAQAQAAREAQARVAQAQAARAAQTAQAASQPIHTPARPAGSQPLAQPPNGGRVPGVVPSPMGVTSTLAQAHEAVRIAQRFADSFRNGFP